MRHSTARPAQLILVALLSARLVAFAALAASSNARVALPHAGAPIARTSAGLVAGTGGDILTFKGIPYAAPPIGDLRWRAPVPPHPWTGVRDATHFGNDCMQTPYVIPTGQRQSEDCLTLNVWTLPYTPGTRRPVMVYFYGGAFIGGSCAYPLYDGGKLAAEGVVVVCFNYRVGIFGLLAHPQLSAESPQHVSGNYTLLDQLAALEWVKANIAAFGGDPGRVTVFGESAGAVSIAVLLSSPLARGLFAQAILQSPVVPPLATLAQAEKSGAALNADLGALRRLTAAQLLAHNDDFFPHAATRTMMAQAFPAPIVDGYVLPVQPRSAFRSGAVNAVPAIVGINADEGRMFTPRESRDAYRAWLQEKFGPLAETLLRLDPAPTDVAATAAASAILGDVTFGESARLIQRGLVRHQARTYAYVFSRSIAGQPQPPTHSEDLPFVFGSLTAPSFIQHPAPDATDLQLSRTMRRIWARFAAHGDPNGPGLPRWPAFDSATEPYLELGTQIRPEHGWHKERLDVLESYYADESP